MRVDIPSHNTHVDFPDDTPHDVINKVLREHFGPEQGAKAVESPVETTPAPIQPPEGIGNTPETYQPEPEFDISSIPDDLAIKVSGIHGESGKTIDYEENAKTALKDVEDRISLYEKIMEGLS